MLVGWSHRGRVRSEAAFASLAGVAPIEASSGQRSRHRLNRGGDRALNRALHTVAITRLRCHPESIAYEVKRSAQGKTHRDVRRSLKRSLAPTPLPTHAERYQVSRAPARTNPDGGLTNIGASNGLLRQYLPRTVNMRDYTQADFDAIADQLNGRPRQTLGFKTPSEALAEVLR